MSAHAHTHTHMHAHSAILTKSYQLRNMFPLVLMMYKEVVKTLVTKILTVIPLRLPNPISYW